jgi:hypothetical protein
MKRFESAVHVQRDKSYTATLTMAPKLKKKIRTHFKGAAALDKSTPNAPKSLIIKT